MKTKIFIIFWIILYFFIIPGQLIAEYYQYTDKNGNSCFTDNINDVPEDQLDQIKSFDSVTSKKSIKHLADQSTRRPDNTVTSDSDTWDGKLKSTAIELEQEQKHLTLAFNALNHKRIKLEEKQLKDMNDYEKKTHKDNVSKLNLKIQQYHEQLKEFKTRLDNFNREMQ